MNPTRAEKLYWSKLAEIVGCIACRKDGRINHYVSIHHCNGRTKKGAHMEVFPLCAGHHQNGAGGDKFTVAIHPFKRQFESLYGTQEELMEECMKIVADHDNHN